MATIQPFTLFAPDGVALAATLHLPDGAPEEAMVAVINAGAGIPQSFYGRFAAGLADRGLATVTYDYRGIGRSRPPLLRGYAATITDWGELDAPAVLGWVRDRYPDRARAVIGHSVGGFLAGYVADPTLIDRLVLVGAHTGYCGDYAAWARPFMWTLWHAVMPAVTRVFGYFPARRFGLPEDLPAGVALDWAARRRPGLETSYRLADGTPDHQRIASAVARFGALRVAALALTTTDDPFATPAATERIISLFGGCRFERVRVDPTQLRLPGIGHFGFFRTLARESLWPVVGDWLLAAAREGPRGRLLRLDEAFAQHF